MNHDKTIRASLKSKAEEVICTEYCAGEGIEGNPMRKVLVWHTTEGSFIGRRDSGYSEHEECLQKFDERETDFATILADQFNKWNKRAADIVRSRQVPNPNNNDIDDDFNRTLESIAKEIEANQ